MKAFEGMIGGGGDPATARDGDFMSELRRRVKALTGVGS